MRCHWRLAKGAWALLLTAAVGNAAHAQLVVTGVIDGPLPGGNPKGIELYVVADIEDLSLYGVGSANNGNGSAGVEFTFPADSPQAGQFLYVALEEDEFYNFFGFLPDYTSGAMSVNGDDAIELFREETVIDIFGVVDVDGTGEPWEYTDGWAYRHDETGPDGAVFASESWSFSGPDALDGEMANDLALMPVPFGSYVGGGPAVVALRAGDADQDLDFDQLDLVRVQIASKYLSGLSATWGDGDWDGAPGGQPGSPPAGNGRFDQLDIVAALNAGIYLAGPYGAAQNLTGTFDREADRSISRTTFAASRGAHPLDNAALRQLGREPVTGDLTGVASLAGDSYRNEVGFVPIPEPASAALLGLGLGALAATGFLRRTKHRDGGAHTANRAA